MKEYLRVSKKIKRFHQGPETGSIILKNESQISPVEFQSYFMGNKKQYPSAIQVPMLVVKLLSCCDGTLTWEEVINKCIAETRIDCDGHRPKELLCKYLKVAIEQEHIERSDFKRQIPVELSGSPEVFLPLHAKIELTMQCNFDCIYCYNATEEDIDNKEDGFLVSNVTLDYLKMLSENGVSVVEITGGEPLLHPNVIEIIEYCGTHFSTCFLFTNGSRITVEIADAISKAKNFCVCLSLDGPVEDVVEKVCGQKNVYHKIKSGLKLLLERNLPVRLNMTLIPENRDYLEDMASLAYDIGACALVVSPVLKFGRASQMSLTEKDMEEFKHVYQKTDKRWPGILPPLPADTSTVNGNCGAGSKRFVVKPNGDIHACILNSQTWSRIGNIIEDDYMSIFKNVKTAFFRTLVIPSRDVCGACKHFWYCGSCFMQAIQKALEVTPDCKWAQKNNIYQYVNDDSAKSLANRTDNTRCS